MDNETVYTNDISHIWSRFNLRWSATGVLAGAMVHFALCAFFGFIFAQFVSEKSRKPILVALSTLAGLAVWLFWATLFMPAFNETMSNLLPKLVSLGLHLFFGLIFGVFVVLLKPRLDPNN